MNKEQIYEYLDNMNIWYEILNHKAVFNMDDIFKIDLPYPEADAKNLFVRDDKKENYYLITIKGNRKINLKEFRKKYNTRPLSFASSDELNNILKLEPGSVTPFGLLNDKENKTVLFIDEYFIKLNLIGIHPNDNKATLWLKTSDLISIMKNNGKTVNTFII